ncbi:MAG: enoyl-CoA hydratase [Rhodobacteraceae bacterium]|nr:MAG: enoyl-CoA hydratase [Paracoccaceae bacterium]
MDGETLEMLNTAMDLAEEALNIKAIIITGTGNTFSSGFDLKDQLEKSPKGKEWRNILDLDFKTIMRFWHSPKPTIAAVRGACLAGAFELALACDITIASKDAFFGEPELRFGAGIVTMILPWVTGVKAAKEIILLGKDNIPAEEALRLGLVTRLTETNLLQKKAKEIALNLAEIDPNLIKDTKKAINQSYEVQGLLKSLQNSLDIDYEIESKGSPDKIRFMEIARNQGMKEAIAYRNRRFKPDA